MPIISPKLNDPKDPFEAFTLKWWSCSKTDVKTRYYKFTVLLAHPDQAPDEAQRLGTSSKKADYGGLTFEQWVEKKDDCFACLDWWAERKEEPEEGKQPRTPPTNDESWNRSRYAMKGKGEKLNPNEPLSPWKEHKLSKPPSETSISIYSNAKDKVEHVGVFSLTTSRWLPPRDYMQAMTIVKGNIGEAIVVQGLPPPKDGPRDRLWEQKSNEWNLGGFAMCPEVRTDTKGTLLLEPRNRLEVRINTLIHKADKLKFFKCMLTHGSAPSHLVFNKERSRNHSDMDFWEFDDPDGNKLERIHLYGTHVTDTERSQRKFDDVKVSNRRVIAYVGDPGSVIAVEQKDGGKRHLVPAGGRDWAILLVFDKLVYRIAELEKDSHYVRRWWRGRTRGSMDELKMNTPLPSEWIKFM